MLIPSWLICASESMLPFPPLVGPLQDVVVIPAGVGHCNLGSSGGFLVVGAYPEGQSWDLRTGEPDERPEVLENIRKVPLPRTDPVFGDEGPLHEHWLK